MRNILVALTFVALAGPALAQGLTEPPAAPGTAPYNEWLGRTFSEVMLNTQDETARTDILNRIVATDYIQHNPLLAEGRQGLIGFIPVIYHAMPDAKFVLYDVFATEQRVVTRWSWTGTLTGAPLLGVAPAGQALEFDAIDIWTVRDGQLYEHWDQFDWPRAFVQLGVKGLPQPFYDVAAQPYDR
ncbi:ester cyclase [uncultured Devosia sp.]|uniref:ester cyclase n=1 Tax=uncultured Devosia sp. TaxID=211434 RepID=UPI0035CBFF01